MDTRWGRIRRAAFAAMIATLVMFLKAPAFAADAVVSDGKLAGAATCATCHAEKAEAFSKTFHGRKVLSNGKLANSCESCHGAGAGHADGGGDITKITNPKKLDAAAVGDLCMGCHKEKALMMWKTGPHATNNISCLQCHSVHEGQGRKSLIKDGTETCYTCHKRQKSDMRLASHHPVPEGKMMCISCHNPHGGIDGNLKADSMEETCFKCHGDKAGPYAYEHPPVADGCTNCHKPHGSANDKLLKQNLPYLCLSCHRFEHSQTRGSATGLPAGVNNAGQQGMSMNLIQQRGRCTDCHNQIHGSDRKAGLKD